MKLKIMCTGEILVDFHQLKDLQLTESGKSLKATSKEKIDKLAVSLKEYGIVNNLQVWIDGDDIYCFDAHHRKKALSQLENEGLEIPLLPATRCLAETITEAKKLLFLKESSNSWIDTNVIKDYLADIDFDIEEARSMIEIPDFNWPEEKGNKDPNKLPEEPKKIVIKKGDLIEIGNHRLLCGDSTIKKDVKRLLNKEECNFVFTDPPYELSSKIVLQCIDNFSPDHILLISTFRQLADIYRADKYRFRFDFVLNAHLPKSFMNSKQPYYTHQNGAYFTNGDIETIFDCKHAKGTRSKNAYWHTIIDSPRDTKTGHGHSKNIQGIIDTLSGFEFDSIIDCFSGSGSSLIACEKIDKRSFSIELEKNNCQIIIQRWCDYTEKTEIKINGITVNWNDYINQ